MLRSILIGLDGSSHSSHASQQGIAWARRTGAMVVGLGIIDEPTIARAEPVLLGGVPYTDPVFYRERMADARRQVDQFLEHFAIQCAEAKVACKVLEDVGLPFEQIALEAQRYDLIMLGGETRFHFEVKEHDDTLHKILKNSPRPVVTVPKAPREGRSIAVAYDGSLQAARTLHAFVATGLHRDRQVHILSAHAEHHEAAKRAERAIDFLRFHEIKAVPHTLEETSGVSGQILDQVDSLHADLLVMGAYGQPALHEFVLGSVTRSLLQKSPVPLFLYH